MLLRSIRKARCDTSLLVNSVTYLSLLSFLTVFLTRGGGDGCGDGFGAQQRRWAEREEREEEEEEEEREEAAVVQ